ncbi:MAG: hypothetical protein LBM75_02660 [Myxococcales bacterium]|jgi:transposase|nr:hypothetical protein [Myxococcales bacterium]
MIVAEKDRLGELDRRLEATIEVNDSRMAKAKSLDSIHFDSRYRPPPLSMTLVALLPEIRQLHSRQIAARRCGLPGALQSRQRVDARQSLFLAILGSWRCNDSPITAFVRCLREKGKPPMVAIVAGMRKLLVVANTLIRKNCSWD